MIILQSNRSFRSSKVSVVEPLGSWISLCLETSSDTVSSSRGELVLEEAFLEWTLAMFKEGQRA